MPRQTKAEKEAAALEAAGKPPAPNMQDGQTAPGFAGDVAPTSIETIREQRAGSGSARLEDEAKQGAYVPPPPRQAQAGYINPPSLEQFSNATYLEVGPEIRKIIDKALGFDELADLRGIQYSAVWRRKGKPHWTRNDEDRQFAGVGITDPFVLWQASRREEKDWPRFTINLFWLHLDELRSDEENTRYVPFEVMERHILMALLPVQVSESGVLTNAGFGLGDWARTVKRYGLFTEDLVTMRRQMALWPAPDEG